MTLFLGLIIYFSNLVICQFDQGFVTNGMHHFHIEEVSNGLEALEFLQLNPVDLMVLDINMPEMDGKEVLKLVRGLKKYKTLPVIVLTTCDDIHNRVNMQSLGASSYMNKPVNPGELLERVKRLLIIKKLSG